ncbi:homoserine O-succinyltransferase [Wenzhouxiangella sp. AB-CW3]|uniref:homoserine O-succinyltransferase MetX n=1 Tax=Wenzhouxiangella sp. AB-CW3 TaxID=2771012 RepID=UPI00168BEBFF|nr:homoserine O-succinyltransferase [Wenzhouxiangella sp. AB-CW3]QOC22655.1 homoserine O-succinyltransferase [Wenzhouxiangella sp. AB-CW3]
MSQTATLAEAACGPTSAPASRQFVSGGLWHDMSWAPGRHKPVRIMYRLEGPAGAPVVLTMGGISASRHVDRWWKEHYGAEGALNPERCRILSIDWLGHRWPDGSPVTTAQQAEALIAVMDSLGIRRLATCIGASYGAMVGLALAARYPERLESLLAISGAHSSHPMATARRMIQREIIQMGVDAGDERRALKLARSLALTTYRPGSLFAERFDHPRPQRVLERLDRYFEHQGRRLIGQFDAERYLCLSESLDLHQVDPGAIRCPVTLVAVHSDELVPVSQLEELDRALCDSSLRVIQSDFGHDAFLKETPFFDTLIRQLVAKGASQ